MSDITVFKGRNGTLARVMWNSEKGKLYLQDNIKADINKIRVPDDLAEEFVCDLQKAGLEVDLK